MGQAKLEGCQSKKCHVSCTCIAQEDTNTCKSNKISVTELNLPEMLR